MYLVYCILCKPDCLANIPYPGVRTDLSSFKQFDRDFSFISLDAPKCIQNTENMVLKPMTRYYETYK